jgi:hypothetical protein
MDIDVYINWLESHPITVDLFKWVIILIIAWAVGFFRYISKFVKKPNIEIISDASRVYIEKIQDSEGQENSVRATFIIDADIVNPTSELVHVRYFRLRFSRNVMFGIFSKQMHSISLPNRPRIKMGDKLKLSKVFFSYFDDEFDSLTMSGELPARTSQNGFLLFNSTTFGDWNPRVKDNKVKVEIRSKLSTGETIKNKQWLRLTDDRKFLEEWIPSILEHVASSGTVNTYINRGE